MVVHPPLERLEKIEPPHWCPHLSLKDLHIYGTPFHNHNVYQLSVDRSSWKERLSLRVKMHPEMGFIADELKILRGALGQLLLDPHMSTRT